MWFARAALVGVLSLALAGPTLAEIDFAAMPKGCSWTTLYSDGQVLTETYVGRKGGKHKTKVTEGKALVRQTTYDAEGRMIRKDWADGKWESFSPYSCFDTVGSCTYRYRNADGADFRVVSKTVAQGKGFAVKAGQADSDGYPDEYFETGDFGVVVKNKSSNYSARLIEMKNCELGS
jgi:YD repeat-containing protein